MAAQPAAELLTAMDTIAKVFAWVPVSEELAGVLCTHLGRVPGDPVRTLANVDEDDIQEAKKLKIGERPLTAVEKGKVVSSWQTARLAAKLEKTTGQIDLEKQQVAEAAKEKLRLLKEQVEVQKKCITNTVGQVSLAEVLDQTLTGTIPMLPNKDIVAARAEYAKVTEGECPKEERPSDAQITAVFFIIGLDNNPFADLAIFGPFQIRLQRKMAMAGIIPVGDGSYRRVEFRGPPDIGVWTVHFTVYKNTLVMGKAVGLNPLDRYIKMIHKFGREYGSKVWHLLYQAEHRFRLEEIPEIRRQLEKEAETVKKAGGTHPFDPARPWHMVWQRATQEQCEKFWRDEFEKPAMAVRLELKRMGEVVDGDAPIEPAPASWTSTAAAELPMTGSSSTAPAKRTATEVEDSSWSWPRRLNKKKKSLCKGWQCGTCPSGRGGSAICPRDEAARHQCAICLGDHPGGASQCDGSGWQKPSKGKGAGYGRGDGSGKGGWNKGNKGRGKNRGRGGRGYQNSGWWNNDQGNW